MSLKTKFDISLDGKCLIVNKNVAWTQNLCSLYAFRNKTLNHKKVKVRNLKDLYKETKDRTKKIIKSLRSTT